MIGLHIGVAWSVMNRRNVGLGEIHTNSQHHWGFEPKEKKKATNGLYKESQFAEVGVYFLRGPP
jgi:hypothetical protein